MHSSYCCSLGANLMPSKDLKGVGPQIANLTVNFIWQPKELTLLLASISSTYKSNPALVELFDSFIKIKSNLSFPSFHPIKINCLSMPNDMKAISTLFALSCGLLLALQTTAKKVRRQPRVQKGSASNEDQFQLPPLPYPNDALEPYISQQTVENIHGKIQADCTRSINFLTKHNPDFDSDTLLVDIVETSRDSYPMIYRNAALCWNLVFFWDCMTEAYDDPPRQLEQALEQDFGSFDNFKNQFAHSGSAVFGSGWTWLVYDTAARKLFVMNTLGADNPFGMNQTWLLILGMDVWEHAYFLDYQNRRDLYIRRFLDRLVDWAQVADNLANAKLGKLNALNDDNDSEDDSEDDLEAKEEEEESDDQNDEDEDDMGDDAASEL